MTHSNIDEHFRAIWRRAGNHPSPDTLTPQLVQGWARERGLDGASAEYCDAGLFTKTPSIILSVGDSKACFPKVSATDDPEWQARNEAAECDTQLWEKVEWFLPLWVPMGKIRTILNEVRLYSKEQAIELFNYHTSTLYTVPFEAICIAQIMPQARSLKEICPLAREAFLAFYSGYRASSISALIPAIEGSLTRIVSDAEASLTIPEKIDRIIDRAIANAANLHFGGMWVPPEYRRKEYLFAQDERVVFFETFRRWLQKSFFRKTGEYDGVTWLNRHVFAHGTDSSWQQSANFGRLIVALATIAAIESWHDGPEQVSVFFPEMNDDSKLLWQQALFQAEAQMSLKMIEQERYSQQGRLVPEMPTDNGVLLRKALLLDDCIKDLVRPLRDAGWSVEVGEADEEALFVEVTASADGEQFGAALLFSCATDNQIYRKLAENAEAILYRGAPYLQDQFAYGIDVHVGPVAGWLPPPAPARRPSGD